MNDCCRTGLIWNAEEGRYVCMQCGNRFDAGPHVKLWASGDAFDHESKAVEGNPQRGSGLTSIYDALRRLEEKDRRIAELEAENERLRNNE